MMWPVRLCGPLLGWLSNVTAFYWPDHFQHLLMFSCSLHFFENQLDSFKEECLFLSWVLEWVKSYILAIYFLWNITQSSHPYSFCYSSRDWFEKHRKELASCFPTTSNTLCEGNICQLCFIHLCNFCQRSFLCFSNSCIVCKTLRLRQVPIGDKGGWGAIFSYQLCNIGIFREKATYSKCTPPGVIICLLLLNYIS